VNKQEICVSSW